VSALVASPTLGVGFLDPVRALQHVLYRAAKADPGRRFHALYDKVHRRDVLQRAWWLVCRNSARIKTVLRRPIELALLLMGQVPEDYLLRLGQSRSGRR